MRSLSVWLVASSIAFASPVKICAISALAARGAFLGASQPIRTGTGVQNATAQVFSYKDAAHIVIDDQGNAQIPPDATRDQLAAWIVDHIFDDYRDGRTLQLELITTRTACRKYGRLPGESKHRPERRRGH